MVDEELRAARLLDAQDRAERLFVAIEERGLIRPGVGERLVSDEIRDLAADLFGVTRHWHKRIVHGGANTLATARDNPPDRIIAEDDIVFLDLGPIFEEWEADFGRTFVLGDDPRKLALRNDLPRIWEAGREFFEATPDVTGAQLFDHVVQLSRAAGWGFGGVIAGHLVGEFPHEKIAGGSMELYVAPGSDQPMRRMDSLGRQCHWILEVHLIEPGRQFGGFHEELLDLRPLVGTQVSNS